MSSCALEPAQDVGQGARPEELSRAEAVEPRRADVAPLAAAAERGQDGNRVRRVSKERVHGVLEWEAACGASRGVSVFFESAVKWAALVLFCNAMNDYSEHADCVAQCLAVRSKRSVQSWQGQSSRALDGDSTSESPSSLGQVH